MANLPITVKIGNTMSNNTIPEDSVLRRHYITEMRNRLDVIPEPSLQPVPVFDFVKKNPKVWIGSVLAVVFILFVV